MADPLILVLDEGTTSTRALLFGPDGSPRGMAQRDIVQHYPQDGRVEHDAAEIWEKSLACAMDMVARAGGAGRIAAIGITNQRETVVAWDADTGKPLTRAIVWQDRRTAAACSAMREAGHEEAVRAKTGLIVDPYFSATKMRWLLDHDEAVSAAAERGTLTMGTVESWLVHKLTGGRETVTDASNASRTLLARLDGGSWDEGLGDLFGVPSRFLPEICDNAGDFLATDPDLFGRSIPICGLAGDQMAATIGQGCLGRGASKATYGTGAFILTNMGGEIPHSDHRLLGTVLCQMGGERTYALEGSVFVAGSLVKWLRDMLGLIGSPLETEELARTVPDNGGVVIVPALTGLGAPHWHPGARGAITGLGFSTGKAHVVRAALEAMAHQTYDLARAFAADGAEWTGLRIDGGMVVNDWMAQDIADLTGLTVTRPDFIETTALGAAMLAAVGCGMHPTLKDAAAAMIGRTREFVPRMEDDVRARRLADWDAALEAVLARSAG